MEFPRDEAYHFPLRSSSSPDDPNKPPMMTNAGHREAQEKGGGRGEGQKSTKQEIKFQQASKSTVCPVNATRLKEKYEKQSQLPLQVTKGRT